MLKTILNALKNALIEILPVFLVKLIPAARKRVLEIVAKSENKIDDAILEAIREAVSKDSK